MHLLDLRDLKFRNGKNGDILIKNLKITDVKSDEAFKLTTARIKSNILIDPVVIADPVHVNYTSFEAPYDMRGALLGYNRNRYHHQISFKYSGDRELFNYKPDNFSFSVSGNGIIKPPTAKEVIVIADITTVDPNEAIGVARNLFSETQDLINENNSSIIAWNTSIELEIDEALQKKREELIRYYGGDSQQ